MDTNSRVGSPPLDFIAVPGGDGEGAIGNLHAILAAQSVLLGPSAQSRCPSRQEASRSSRSEYAKSIPVSMSDAQSTALGSHPWPHCRLGPGSCPQGHEFVGLPDVPGPACCEEAPLLTICTRPAFQRPGSVNSPLTTGAGGGKSPWSLPPQPLPITVAPWPVNAIFVALSSSRMRSEYANHTGDVDKRRPVHPSGARRRIGGPADLPLFGFSPANPAVKKCRLHPVSSSDPASAMVPTPKPVVAPRKRPSFRLSSTSILPLSFVRWPCTTIGFIPRCFPASNL